MGAVAAATATRSRCREPLGPSEAGVSADALLASTMLNGLCSASLRCCACTVRVPYLPFIYLHTMQYIACALGTANLQSPISTLRVYVTLRAPARPTPLVGAQRPCGPRVQRMSGVGGVALGPCGY